MATPKPETGVGETGSPDDGDTSGQELVAGLTAADDAVVEVAAAHPDVPLAMAALLAADVSGGHRGVHAVPRAQIHLASWMDWFPARGQASAAFVDLSTVFAAYDREWRREGLADPDGFWGFKPAPVLGDRVNAPALARRDVFACPRFLAAGDPPAPLRSL